MKKLLTVLTLMVAVLTLTGCEDEPKELTEEELFNQAVENMATLENFTMEVTMNDVPFFGTVTFELRQTDQFMETVMFGETSYEYIYEDEVYELIPFLDTYTMAYEPTVDDDNMFGVDPDQNFIFDEFNLEEGYYVYNGDEFEGMEDFKLKVENGYITEMLFTVTEDGLTISAEMVLSDIGTTELFGSTPTVFNPEGYADAVKALAEAGIFVTYEADFIQFTDYVGFEIMYVLNEGPTTMGSFEYNPVDNTYYCYDGTDEGLFPIDTCYAEQSNLVTTKEIIGYMDTILDAWNDYDWE